MHIVIVNRWPRFHDGCRWDNELTRYEEFFNHQQHRISYVVDRLGAEGVLVDPQQIAHLVQIDDVNQYPQLLGAVQEIIEQVGPVDQLIALSEFTLEIAAQVREALNIAGDGPQQVAVYRDKARMKEILKAQGLCVPAFARCESVVQVLSFARTIGYPVIVKPVDGAASIGVEKALDEHALHNLLQHIDLARYEIEAFIEGQTYHIDGLVEVDGSVPFQVVSRYINSCLDFAQAQPLGSVIIQESPLRSQIEAFSKQVVSALQLRCTAFHLEIFVQPDGSLVFLEIGARVGGSEVPHLINKVFGINLYEHWLRRLAGDQLQLPIIDQDPSGGWLIIPKPVQLPCRVVQAHSLRDSVPMLWRELLPEPGQILDAGGGYDALHSGRFIFIGGSEATIEEAIQYTTQTYQFQAEPL
ncbi:acetyl-CoA carboxylase biotin carboxylase subunit family protein [Pseudomonas sp. 5P_3.1_Bac2]|uniref:ATP-grasp domain-containing protein n=1 Tax=Pseudomonas sp. 5P_3.1_Bac2 TaxID=2971617 RepID=UPI0021CAC9C6|nr:ATP-grasp domain-containing protein [Pseudomonas sp. 5P_3.1_Bac2]MCU1719025.1 ATP-grasp domain-containing protein [Pseudomonas sp. 5P_3.1_Bac2]